MKLQKILITCLLAAAIALVGIFVLPTNAQAATSGYYTYEVSNGEATITNCDTAISGDIITIPSTLGGYPVTTIGFGAFQSRSSLTSITIPEGVTSIGEFAFRDCSSLTSITIPSSVTSIGSSAFSDCSSLESITLPEGVTNIGNWTFWHCGSLISITIPDSVTSIGHDAFSDCSSLKSITIPNGVTSIGDRAFSGCSSLESITLSEGVTSIGHHAFESCSSLTSITIPKGVTSIGEGEFYCCTSLESITIPSSVTSIDNSAFILCSSLKDVYYGGTESQWKAFDIGDYKEKPLADATIHYDHVHDFTILPPVTVPATCEEAGYVEYTCVWGESYRETLLPLGHITGTDAKVVAPICTEQGYTLSTCPRCRASGKTQFIPILGHDFSGKATVTAPTCTEQGYTTVQCTRCEEAEKQALTDSLGHAMAVLPAVPSTCTEPGLTAGTACQRCGLVGVAQKPVESRGHTLEEGFCIFCSPEKGRDFNLDRQITDADAIYLLRNTLFPESYPLSGNGDINCDGWITDADAIYLLRHTLFPESYPLYPRKEEA